MQTIGNQTSQYSLAIDGLPFIEHDAGMPFVSAIKREKRYESNRGTVRETVTETELTLQIFLPSGDIFLTTSIAPSSSLGISSSLRMEFTSSEAS